MWNEFESCCGKNSYRRCASRACGCCCSCAAVAVHRIRLRREPGRGPRAHRLDGYGPHAREPGPARPLRGSGRFDVVAMPANEEQVQAVLDRSQAQAVVRVLPGFARDLARAAAPKCRCWWTAPIPTPRR